MVVTAIVVVAVVGGEFYIGGNREGNRDPF